MNPRLDFEANLGGEAMIHCISLHVEFQSIVLVQLVQIDWKQKKGTTRELLEAEQFIVVKVNISVLNEVFVRL